MNPQRKNLGPLLCVGLLIGTPPAHALDIHSQQLPGAPGLAPSNALNALDGVQEALNCGLDVLNTAKNCGLSSVSEVTSPFLVRFDPAYCRLTMRFPIGELIDNLLQQWSSGAFHRSDLPWIGALCLLDLQMEACQSGLQGAASRLFRAPAAAPPPPNQSSPGGPDGDARGLDALLR